MTHSEPIIFRALNNGGRLFRVLVYRINFRGNKATAACIALSEVRAPNVVGGTLFNLLRMSVRFRDEVLAPDMDKLEAVVDDRIEARLKNLRGRLDAIEKEADSSGFMDPKKVKQLFSDKTDKTSIDKIFKEWPAVRTEFNEAVEEVDRKKVESALKKMFALHSRFMPLVAERYAEGVCDDYDTEPRSVLRLRGLRISSAFLIAGMTAVGALGGSVLAVPTTYSLIGGFAAGGVVGLLVSLFWKR